MQLQDRYERPCRLLFSLLGESVAYEQPEGKRFLTDKILLCRGESEIALCEGGCITFA
jgi:hypothetical protein